MALTRREVDAFLLTVMQNAFLNLQDCGGRADGTVKLELQQAMQLLPPPITNITPLAALQGFLQYGTATDDRPAKWMPTDPKQDALWRCLEALDESMLSLVTAGAQLLNFACLQQIELNRIKRRDAAALAARQEKQRQITGVAVDPDYEQYCEVCKTLRPTYVTSPTDSLPNTRCCTYCSHPIN